MRWFTELIGSPDDALLSSGELARGHITSLSASSMSMSVMNGLRERKCTFAVRVYRDGHEPYDATAVQRVQEVYMPQLASGRAWVAVRVDPSSPARIALDFATAPPEVQVQRPEGEVTADDILTTGTPVDVILVQAQPLGMTGPSGDPVYALTVTVMAEGEQPYQTQVGNPVPNSALPRLYPGSRLAAKRGQGQADIVVDFSAPGPVAGG